jgi:hypothetical protein
MIQVLDAELLKDIATDLLVVTRPEFGEGVCRFIVPLLALGQEQVEQGRPVRSGLEEECVEIHGSLRE